jgi:RimJ/RimL family protein N-acetyltransferase
MHPNPILSSNFVSKNNNANDKRMIMAINKNEIVLKPLLEEDIALFSTWLNKEYIYKWFCPNGEEEREAWLNEINERNGKFHFLSHFIVYHNDKKIGYCLYADCFFLKDIQEENYNYDGADLYGDIPEKNHTYEIGFLIGEEEYLNKGIGKIVIQRLEEKIIEIGGKEIASDPSEKNIASVKTLLSNGFVQVREDDYRKKLY